MRDDPTTRKMNHAGFARAALGRAEAILARIEAGGDAHAIERWRRVVSALELEAVREIVAQMRGAA